MGIAVLSVFLLMAGSVVCLASSQASTMVNCGNNMGTGAICPFMSASVPAVASASSAMKVLALTTALVVLIGFAASHLAEDNDARKFHLFSRQRNSELPLGVQSNVVLGLISDGILHSRVFRF